VNSFMQNTPVVPKPTALRTDGLDKLDQRVVNSGLDTRLRCDNRCRPADHLLVHNMLPEEVGQTGRFSSDKC
jgi:hypothetical protein